MPVCGPIGVLAMFIALSATDPAGAAMPDRPVTVPLAYVENRTTLLMLLFALADTGEKRGLRLVTIPAQ